jgi:hypothetical protein
MAEEEFNLASDSTEATKKKKSRSPNYPAIGLEKALDRARTLQEHGRHHFMPVATAHTLWNYKKGAGDQTIAALKYFGLLEVQGEKEGRQVRLTDMAKRILGNAPDRATLLKVAALKPDLHKELWDKYEEDLPADQIIRDYLVWERNFNEDFVDSFIAQFRSTLAYAKLDLSDKIRDDSGEEEEEEENEGMTLDPNAGTQRGKQSLPPSTPHGYKDFPLHLTKHQKGALYIPAEMSQTDYQLLKTQLNNYMAVIKLTSVVGDDAEAADEQETETDKPIQ